MILRGHIPSKADVQKQETYLTETLNPAIEKAKNGEIYLLFLDAAHFVMGVFLLMPDTNTVVLSKN